jgi:hypothetical protein
MHARHFLGFAPLVLLFGSQGVGPAEDPLEFGSPSSAWFDLQAELARWRAQAGDGWRAEYESATGHAKFLWGASARIGFAPRDGADAAALARLALDATRALHGVDPDTLLLERATFLPLSFAGSSDKWSVRFTQALGGLPVQRASVNVLLDTGGRLLAVDAHALTDVSALATAPALSPDEALAGALGLFAAVSGVPAESAGTPELAVAQALEGKFRAPRLVWQVELRAGGGASAAHGWRFALDAHTGAEVERTRLVHEFDVSGQVRSLATPGLAPDTPSNPETSQPMPYLRVTSAQGSATTDALGHFTIAGASAPLSVTVVYEGLWAATNNDPGADYSLATTLNAPAGNVIAMNPAGTGTVTAEANAFAWIGWMHDWTHLVNPFDATSDFLAPANVNLPQTCNAYYDGVSVNFFAAGGGCPNTAYSTVVLHEMGHWLNDLYFSGNGSDGFGEGNADVFAMYMTESAIVGQDFCGTGCHVRDGNNTTPYCGDGNGGCYGEVHLDGEVLMGALWKVRTRLKNSLGQGPGGVRANTLFNGWMNAFDDYQIDSIIELHWLALDDDDGSIDNGTPNHSAIDLGFRDQGFPGFDLPNLAIAEVTALPDTLDGSGPFTVDAEIVAQFFPPVVAPTLEWRVNGGAWTPVAMLATGGDGYTADIPGQFSPAKVEYRVTAQDANGNGGTSAAQFFLIGQKTLLFTEGFEGGAAGWTHGQIATQDDWQRSADQGLNGAAGKSGDPTAAFSGTNIWGNDLGAGTFNGAYQDNVHNWLRSPAIDFTGEVGATLRFRRWLTVEKSVYDQARVLVDGIEVWRNPPGVDLIDSSWNLTEVDISGAADGKSNVRIEFQLQSDGGLVFGGWNLDDVEVYTLEAVCAPPTLNGPLAQVACVGSPATFSTTAGGSGPFTYQWRKNTLPILGANGPSYTIAAVQSADAGVYSVTVDNACGSITSGGVPLTVNQPTTASTPSGATVCAGAPVQFSTTPGGTAPFTYQWKKGAAPIPGANAATFAIASAQAGDAGLYSVDVTGACGLVTSGSAALVVNGSPTASAPLPQTVCAGSPASFSTTAGGSGPFTYQWKKGGAPIGGATAASYAIASAQAADAGLYSVVVGNACGSVESTGALLTVHAAVGATTPANQSVCVGSPASFSTTASGSGPFSYQWKKNGSPIGGATASSHSIPSAQGADAGLYSVVVTGACGSLETPAATLAVSGVATIYCTAKVSSHLCVPSIGASGVPSLSAPAGFSALTTTLESGVTGLDFFGTTGQVALPFQGGLICIATPVNRLPGKATGGAGTCTGTLSYSLSEVLVHPSGGSVVAGGTLNLQTWTRDLGDAFGSSLSNAVQVTICP